MKGKLERIVAVILGWVGVAVISLVGFIYIVDSDVVRIFLPVAIAIPAALLAGGVLVTGKWVVAWRQGCSKSIGARLFGILSILAFISATIVFSAEQPEYVKQQLSFASQGTQFSGTLYLPDTSKKHAAVVIIHGSPCAPRAMYHVWADNIVSHGIATLSFDKRGTGRSGGDCQGVVNNASIENLNLLASDVVSALIALKSHPNVDSTRLGLWAISQGGWIAPIVADQLNELKCMAIVSGPSVSVGEESYYSALTGDGHDEVAENLPVSEIERRVDTIGASGFDPRSLLRQLSIAALWVHGGSDQSVPVSKCVRVLDSLISSGKPFEYRIYPGSRHILIDPTFPFDFAEGSLDYVSEWLVTKLK